VVRQDEFVPGPILLIGAPGVGKGTQAKAIVAAWAIPQISTGDLLRGNVAEKTELGQKAQELMQHLQRLPAPAESGWDLRLGRDSSDAPSR
jgi:adenylate kinase family enzyme